MTTAHGESDWKIRINGGEDHPIPHAHILFRDGSRVSVALDSLEILAAWFGHKSESHQPLPGYWHTVTNCLSNTGG